MTLSEKLNQTMIEYKMLVNTGQEDDSSVQNTNTFIVSIKTDDEIGDDEIGGQEAKRAYDLAIAAHKSIYPDAQTCVNADFYSEPHQYGPIHGDYRVTGTVESGLEVVSL